uniref:Putative homing endonuclease n=1 Tax=viral metagenome TaxID=1070528 RepID=A0A6H1ZUS4_9ZZZZ
MLSEKYLAGFLDSDGSVWMQYTKEGWKPSICMLFSQKTSQDEVLSLIQEDYGGTLKQQTIKGVQYSSLGIYSKAAVGILNRIKKYLVIKRHYVEACLEVERQRTDSIEKTKAYLKEQRKVRSLPLPNFPSRKWLAGYLDGDGCFHGRVTGRYGSASIQLHVAASNYDTEGLEIIHKAFGGGLYDMCNGRVTQYRVMLPPSKAKSVLPYFAKHMIVKRDQVYFILGCAEMGHYRDGKYITATLKHLKAHEHRLNEPRVDVAKLVDCIKNVPKPWNKKGLAACVKCERSDQKHICFGLCRTCYLEQQRNKTATTYATVEAA